MTISFCPNYRTKLTFSTQFHFDVKNSSQMFSRHIMFPSTLFLSFFRPPFTFYVVWWTTSPPLLSTHNILSFLPVVCLFICVCLLVYLCLPLLISSTLFGVILQVSPFSPTCKTCLNKTCFGLFRVTESRVPTGIPLTQLTYHFCKELPGTGGTIPQPGP